MNFISIGCACLLLCLAAIQFLVAFRRKSRPEAITGSVTAILGAYLLFTPPEIFLYLNMRNPVFLMVAGVYFVIMASLLRALARELLLLLRSHQRA